MKKLASILAWIILLNTPLFSQKPEGAIDPKVAIPSAPIPVEVFAGDKYINFQMIFMKYWKGILTRLNMRN